MITYPKFGMFDTRCWPYSGLKSFVTSYHRLDFFGYATVGVSGFIPPFILSYKLMIHFSATGQQFYTIMNSIRDNFMVREQTKDFLNPQLNKP